MLALCAAFERRLVLVTVTSCGGMPPFASTFSPWRKLLSKVLLTMLVKNVSCPMKSPSKMLARAQILRKELCDPRWILMPLIWH